MIGEGGLGRVYRAVRISTGGVVAIKELREVPSASPAWHRAKRELDAMLRLKGHPYVVSVEEIIDGPKGPCLVMEYLDSGSLMDRLANGRLTAPELVLVGQQVCHALADAHAAGIVHRDVKPHNLLVGAFGQVKVADFGIAALTRGVGLNTRTKAFTLAYASPEELDDDAEVGAPADVYSFAATMSHLATGRKPSFRDRGASVDLPEVAALHPALVLVSDALQRCLQTNPALRPTMRDLQQVFDASKLQLGALGITRLSGSVSRPTSSSDGDSTTTPGDVGATVIRPRVPGANSITRAPSDYLGADDAVAATIIRQPVPKPNSAEPTTTIKAAGTLRPAGVLRETATLFVVLVGSAASIAAVANGLLVLLKLL